MIFVWIIFSFFILPYAHAEVVINEFAVQPTQTVELLNTASTSADISHWYIDDSGGSTYYTIPPETVLPPFTCAVFISDFNFNKSSADTIRLFNSSFIPTSSSATLVDAYTYAKMPQYSYVRIPDGGLNWQEAASSFGFLNTSTTSSCLPPPSPIPSSSSTPTVAIIQESSITQSPSSTPTSLPDYEHIIITEVYPYPDTNEKEWIELYNNNDMRVELSHWFIDDAAGSGSSPRTISLSIDPYSFAIVELPSSMLNNAGDSVRLLNTDLVEKYSMEYGTAHKQKSFGLITLEEQEYCLQNPSPRTLNQICDTNTPKEQLIDLPIHTVSSTRTSPTLLPLSTNSQPVMHTFPTTQHSEYEKDVLGTFTSKTVSPAPYLSILSCIYSLLTIVGVFIKINHAQIS